MLGSSGCLRSSKMTRLEISCSKTLRQSGSFPKKVHEFAATSLRFDPQPCIKPPKSFMLSSHCSLQKEGCSEAGFLEHRIAKHTDLTESIGKSLRSWLGFESQSKKDQSRPLGLQTPSKKVLWGAFRGLSTFLEGIWNPRGQLR